MGRCCAFSRSISAASSAATWRRHSATSATTPRAARGASGASSHVVGHHHRYLRMAPREHLSVLSQDARYALRMMRKNIGYTARRGADPRPGHRRQHFDLQRGNSVLLKPLPYPQGDRPGGAAPARREAGHQRHGLLGPGDQRLPASRTHRLTRRRGIPWHDLHPAGRQRSRAASAPAWSRPDSSISWREAPAGPHLRARRRQCPARPRYCF